MGRSNPLLRIFLLATITLTSGQVVNAQVPVGTVSSTRQDYYLPTQVMSSGRVALVQCYGATSSPAAPYRPGMFIFDGDFESWTSTPSLANLACVSSQPNLTHYIASLQISACQSSAWKVSHGTPEIGSDNGNKFIHLWSGDWNNNGDKEGEGIFYDCELDYCEYYSITLRLKTGGKTGVIDKVRLLLGQGLTHKSVPGTVLNTQDPAWNPEEGTFYKVPGTTRTQVLLELTNFSSAGWTTITIPTFRPDDHHMKFWILTEDSGISAGDNLDMLFIDNVTDGQIGSNETCNGYNMVIGTGAGGGFPSTFVGPRIRANTLTNTGVAIVNSGQSSDIGVNTAITFKPGFLASAGSTLWAHIIPCATANVCPLGSGSLRRASDDATVELTSNELEAIGISISPNPTPGLLDINLNFSETNDVNVQILDQLGQVLITKKYPSVKNLKEQADLSGLADGMYIIQIKTNKGTVVQKVLKE